VLNVEMRHSLIVASRIASVLWPLVGPVGGNDPPSGACIPAEDLGSVHVDLGFMMPGAVRKSRATPS
jgi:hypothetical protein